ncbi:MAG: hypothetical protein COA94_07945 [Rickettsiales bacterium]|nr:MAG: hypothetical protein COA94_07945 [Rickettsiales bacterium]
MRKPKRNRFERGEDNAGFEEAVNAMIWLIEHYKTGEGNESFAIYDVYGCAPIIEGSFNSRLYRD